ncbi:MAG: hypothetical protein DI598_11980 [Pseudopedobacter saltans]|uniref:Tyr recombinase domain-containing protein n=1 Tax=Pseudopedobacter saltans TaxID=151895 RepID=A0A2W5ET98_9SPHI|nr:MAG: hypothetical protein DI598_11980 [Pseudopedobacter saltans]
MNVRYYLKNAKGANKSTFFAMISFDGDRLKYYVPYALQLPNKWDSKKQECTNKVFETVVRTRLQNFTVKISKVFYDLSDALNGQKLSKEKLKNELDKVFGKTYEEEIEFFSLFKSIIDDIDNGTRLKPGGGYVKPMRGLQLKNTYGLLMDFAPDLTFSKINIDFYRGFVNYLFSKDLSANYVGAHIQRLRAILNEAASKGLIKPESYKNFAKPSPEVDSIALSEKELRDIEALELEGMEDRVRDLFVIGCRTALRFSDISRLNEFFTIRNGYLSGIQQKTGGKVVIPLHASISKLLEKYNGQFPEAPENQTANRTLKDICQKVPDLCELESIVESKGDKAIYKKVERWTLISSHTARRTAATLLYLAGVDTISIRSITGHKTEAAFLKYIRVSNEQHAAIVAKFWQNESNNLKIV